MSESTPERLKEFRAGYRSRNSATRISRLLKGIILVAVVAAGLWGVEVLIRNAASGVTALGGGLSPEQWRAYAIYLEGKGLPNQAFEAYKSYLDCATLSDSDRAHVCYTVAQLASDTKQYETALAYLYQAEMLDPESVLKSEIDKKVVFCLDKLGRTGELRRELRNRTDMTRQASDVAPDEIILAEFGGDVITDRDLEAELDKLPPSVRSSFESPEQKIEYLKHMVAQRLLVEKALRLELDHDPAIQAQLAKQCDVLIVQKLVNDSLGSRAEPTPEDVERFYKAEPDLFKTADDDEVPPFEQVKDRAVRLLQARREQEGFAHLVEQTLKERDVRLYPERLESPGEDAP